MRHAIRLLCLGLALGLAPPARAAPAGYALEPEKSTVGFETDFGPDRITGTMPVLKADLRLDFAAPANSAVDVTLDVANAQASFPFATQALRGPKVLDAAANPTIRFVSTRIRPAGDGASVEGNITIRGVTRPIALTAAIYQQKGSAAGDLSHLTVRLTGTVHRSAFGAVGWNDMVGDAVRLDILARVQKTD